MFVSARDLARQDALTLSTGSSSLDELIGGLKGGVSYLFYGSGDSMDNIVLTLIVRATFQGKVAYMNNTDYYSEKTLVRPDRLAFYAKRAGVEPEYVFNRVYFVAAYNELRQRRAVDALTEMLRKEETTKLVLIHNLARFLPEAKNRRQAIENLNKSLAPLWQLATERKIVLMITAHASRNDIWTTPRSSGSHMLWHLVNIMVFFRESNRGRSTQVTLVKHPSRSTPQTVELSQGGGPLMGRLTPPFTQVYYELIQRLRRDFVPLLRDAGHREAFEALISDGWDRERAAMSNSEIPLMLDVLNLTANVRNKSQIEILKRRVEELEKRLTKLEPR